MLFVVAIVLGLAAAAVAVLWLLRRRLAVIDVDGPSMEPTFRTGDRVLVRRVGLHRVRTGDIVVLRRPDELPVGLVHGGARLVGARSANSQGRKLSARHWVIKRAAAVPGDPVLESVASAVGAPPGSPVPAGHLVALGDNAAMSYDSRNCGYFSADHLLGVAVRRI